MGIAGGSDRRAHAMKSLLVGVAPFDLWTFFGVSVLLAAVALVGLLGAGETGDADGSGVGAEVRVRKKRLKEAMK
jgi:hypothetical protein